jgi:MarR family transcriptional regulator for hemolysin
MSIDWCYAPARTLPGNPIGLTVARTAKAVTQAFDAALAAAGGSRPAWVILLALKSGRAASQNELAESVGIRGATLTHHLNAMEKNGLLTRRRHPDNRRVHQVELTEAGENLFRQLRGAAMAFDRKLRAGLSEEEVAGLGALLDRLRENVDAGAPADG